MAVVDNELLNGHANKALVDASIVAAKVVLAAFCTTKDAFAVGNLSSAMEILLDFSRETRCSLA